MNWFYKIRDGLKSRGFKQSEIDQCLFIKNGIICLIYVDDTIFLLQDHKLIDEMVTLPKRILTLLMREM